MFKMFLALITVCSIKLATAQTVPFIEFIPEEYAKNSGYDLQGLQWLTHSSSKDINHFDGFNIPEFEGVRWATAQEVQIFLKNGQLENLASVFFICVFDDCSAEPVIRGLQYGALNLDGSSGQICNLDGSQSFSPGAICTTTKDASFSIPQSSDNIEPLGGFDDGTYTIKLLVKGDNSGLPDGTKWDEFTEVSEADDVGLDLSGLTWMRYTKLAGMSSLDIRGALEDGGALSDWRWATAKEIERLLASDNEGQFKYVFFGSYQHLVMGTPIYFGGTDVDAADCNPYAVGDEERGEDIACYFYASEFSRDNLNQIQRRIQYKPFVFPADDLDVPALVMLVKR